MSTIEFNEQLLSLRQQLYYFALGLTKDRDNALDLVQESILRAITFRDKFRDNTNFKAWVYTIAKNTFINSHRRDKRTRVIMDSVERERDQASRVQTPASVEANVKSREIELSLERLDPAFRTAFMMHFEGYKYQEIAEHMRIPVGTVKSRIHQARQRLQESLTDSHQRN